MRFSCGQFSLDLPVGWMDTTEEPEPFTLSKAEGVGALQFSVAIYSAGQVPGPTTGELSNLLSEFAKTHGLGEPSEHFKEGGQISLAAAAFHPDQDTFVRAWYLSDGFGIAKITYVCHSSNVSTEISEAELIVRSFQFIPSGT